LEVKMIDKTIPAFPTERIGVESGEVLTYQEEGMTLRDYFAAKALQGLISTEGAGSAERYAEISYRLADAMLKARDE
jgi:hypothetical protein